MDVNQIATLAAVEAGQSDLLAVHPSEWATALPSVTQRWLTASYLDAPEAPAVEGKYMLEALRTRGPHGLVWVHCMIRDCPRLYESLIADREVMDELNAIAFLRGSGEEEVALADRAAYLISGAMCRYPRKFTEDKVMGVLKYNGTDVGKLAVVSNLMKYEDYRISTWKLASSTVLKALESTSIPLVYRGMMCVWLAGFNDTLGNSGLPLQVVSCINKVLTDMKTEKLIRITLLAVQNLVRFPTMCEEMAETGTEKCVSDLEYEKWRDPELIELIRTLIAKLQTEVKLLTNFERYAKEVRSGKLKWGFIHSEKFWLDNVLKCEEKNFQVIDFLMAIVRSEASSPESLAVACHDLGEFARLHPVGKAIATSRGTKDKMLELMSDTHREVAREALLCVQKLMLNKIPGA